MTDPNRKALFSKLISLGEEYANKELDYKEWNKLILKEIGILDNLLPDYINNNLWNIILDYLQIPLPKYSSHSPYFTKAMIGKTCVCNYCNNLLRYLIYFDFQINNNRSLHCIICESCLFDDEYTDEKFEKYCTELNDGMIMNEKIDRKYPNIFLWLGLADFDIFYYRKTI